MPAVLFNFHLNDLAGSAPYKAGCLLRIISMSGLTQIEITLATYKAIEAARLSFGESHDEIMQRVLAARRQAGTSPIRDAARTTAPAIRKHGNISVDLFGRIVPVANFKAAYIAILNALMRHKPSLFELLAHEGTARRRWIARSADALYPHSPHLARDHALGIGSDWFIDTNLSRKQIDQRLEVAARIAGYHYPKDIGINENSVSFVP